MRDSAGVYNSAIGGCHEGSTTFSGLSQRFKQLRRNVPWTGRPGGTLKTLLYRNLKSRNRTYDTVLRSPRREWLMLKYLRIHGTTLKVNAAGKASATVTVSVRVEGVLSLTVAEAAIVVHGVSSAPVSVTVHPAEGAPFTVHHSEQLWQARVRILEGCRSKQILLEA
eukprot:366256-Chlamydomonas_euryale.AAC.13